MDKRALQNYAVWAKRNLESQIEVTLKSLGINSERDIKESRVVGERTIIDGDMNSYAYDLNHKRKQIIDLVKKDGYSQVIEEFAYTWFNRIIALRFMEVHDFLPHGFRVLSSRDGGFEPEILKNLNFVITDLNLNPSTVVNLQQQGNIDELFRYVLFKQCKALSSILPMLFANDLDYLELLLPKSLLKGETFITKLLEIGEDDFLNDVEVIGWLYQFYNSQKKAEVFATNIIITKDTLPAATQLFTPDWIVRYMVENSIGRLWLESYPDSSLKSEMKYYVEDAKQEEDVQLKLDEIKYKNVNPEDIKIIEPCCGSGHILVCVFDLLYKMYEEKGYQLRQIPTLILKNNLVGLEIDKRAAQLSLFSLIMKARAVNSRFFNESYFVMPKILEIWDSRALFLFDYKNLIKDLHVLTNAELKDIEWLAEKFRDAKTIGSLLKVEKKNFESIRKSIKKIQENGIVTVFNNNFFDKGIKCLNQLVEQAEIMSSKYDVMITNPPYIGVSKMEKSVKDYANNYYPNSKTDMYAMFMDTEFVKKNGFRTMINQHQWMFASSFENFRLSFIQNFTIENAVHLGTRAFEELNGEKVQSVAFVVRKTNVKYKGKYLRLVDYKHPNEKIKMFFDAISFKTNTYEADYLKFSHIAGKPFAYWISTELSDTFKRSPVEKYAYVGKGLDTCNQDLFERLWFEIDYTKLSFDGYSTNKKWFSFSKGGGFRRWYGNLINVVDWSNNGYAIRNYRNSDGKIKSRPQNIDKYFKCCVTWSSIGTGSFGARILNNSVYGNGAAMFCNNSTHEKPLMALLNSNITKMYLEFLSPGLSFNAGDLKKIPVYEEIFQSKILEHLIDENIEISKIDWDSSEISYDFRVNPLIQYKTKNLSDSFGYYYNLTNTNKNKLHENEVHINEELIRIYHLEKEIISTVDEKDISIEIPNKSSTVKNMISYLIGIEMGRYSLDVEGLAYAGGEWNPMKYVTYQPDDDGIIPLYSSLGMSDSLTARLIHLIKHVYGEDTYKENIDFIADALGKKSNESSEETLNRYLNDEFYADHLKIYQKRPIYWMFSSGKNNAFKCLIYLHRYNEDTLARINSRYFLNESARLNAEVEECRNALELADNKEKIKLDKQFKLLNAKQKEMIEYGQVLDHMANKYIPLDLDDGVKVNYAKFQGIEIVNDNGVKVKKDLLIPIK